MANGYVIEDLGNWRGPQGPQGEQGEQGPPGFEEVPTDPGIATLLDTPASLTGIKARTLFASPGMPSNVLALTRDGLKNKNAGLTLRSWYAALADRRERRVNIVAIGDSIVEGSGVTTFNNRWITRLATSLRERYPVAGVVGGRGFLASDGSTIPGWPLTAATGDTSNGSSSYGPKRKIKSLGTTGSLTWTLTGTYADIMYLRLPGGGSFTVHVDGVLQGTISTNGATAADGVKSGVSLGAAGVHTLKLTAVNPGAYIDGVIEYNGDQAAGITVHDAGHGGWKAADFANTGANPVSEWPAALAALNPDLFLIAIGTNDLGDGNPAAFFTALHTYAAMIRGNFPLVPVVFVPYGPAHGYEAIYPQYVEAMYSVADQMGLALVADIALRMPPYNTGGTFSGDGIHLANRGAQMVADLVGSFLATS